MLRRLSYPIILGGVLGLVFCINTANAQYDEQWNYKDPWNADYIYFKGCENTDADAAKEIVFSLQLSGQIRYIVVIDGITGDEEWDSGEWNAFGDILLIDVDGDGRYEILFKGKKLAGDYYKWYLYKYTGAGKEESSQKVYKPVVFQNYPNPTSSATRIKYSLPQKGKVTLKIYNEAGQLVRTLVDGEKKLGEYTILWDGRNNRGEKVVSGSYFYQIEAGKYRSSKKMILMK